MVSDRLYELAFAFRKTKLWKDLYDTELFAVSLPDGQTGYCNIMGMQGEHLALALYVGNEGLDNFRLLMDLYEDRPNPLKMQELLFGQNCLQCSFEQKDELSPEELSSVRAYTAAHGINLRGANAFPQFIRYRPARFPEPISGEGEEVQRLCAALEAALAIDERRKHTELSQLGFAEGPAYDRSIPLLSPSEDGFAWTMHPLPPKLPESYPEPVLTDDLLMARLQKAEKHHSVWICDVVMSPEPFQPDDTAIPLFPYVMLYANTETQMAKSVEPVTDYERDAQTLLRNLCVQMLEEGVPEKILAADGRTRSLVKNLAAALDLPLVEPSDRDLLDEMEMQFFSQMTEGSLFPEDGNEEEMLELTEGLLQAMPDELLQSMPDELFDQMYSMVGQGILDKDMEALLRRIAKKRQ